MFGPRELDLRNTYKPDLQNIQESAERTYGEANWFYRTSELALKDIEARILSGELSSEKDIYDVCNAIASDLAKCCEIYLKALYIYEHNIPGYQIDELWKKLKNSDYQTDANGHFLYETPSGEVTFVKYDSSGNPIKDSNEKIVYFDKNNNTYNENNRGKKIKRNGHQLDRLIEWLSQESRLLLEARMLRIPMDTTEKNPSISILDVLLEKGVLTQENQILSEQYIGWIEQHKKTFEEARYSGEKQYDLNIEFLYHLATQIKAVVQYRIDPKNNQRFTVSDEEVARLPLEIRKISSSHLHLLSEDLIKLIITNEEIKKKFVLLFSNEKDILPKNISQVDFYNMIKIMDYKEIIYACYLYFLIRNYEKISSNITEEFQQPEFVKVFEVAGVFNSIGYDSNNVIGLLIQVKEIFKVSIGSESMKNLISLLRNQIVHNRYFDNKLNDNNKNYKNNNKL